MAGYITLFGILAVGTAIGLPRQIAAFSAGYLLSFSIGVCIATLATTLGCYLTYQLAQLGLYDFFKRRFPTKVANIHAFLANATFTKAIIIRLLPLGSNFITNLVAGATRTPVVPYVSGSLIGFIPQMILFSLLGSGVSLTAQFQTQFSASLFIIAIIMVFVLYYRHKKSRLTKR